MKVQTAVITHPGGVHLIIFSGRLPKDFILASANNGVAASPATGADAFGFFEEPNAHFESKIGAGQGSNRTDIHRI